MYTAFRCLKCKNETILLTGEYENTEKKSRYIVCSHCSSKKITKSKKTNDLREIMKEKKYKRIHGALRQVR